MKEYRIGSFVISRAGHDFNKIYVILYIEGEYVYLVDGRIRTIDRPKKKKIKHIGSINYFDQCLADKVINNSIKNEEIKRAIRLLQSEKSSKEVE